MPIFPSVVGREIRNHVVKILDGKTKRNNETPKNHTEMEKRFGVSKTIDDRHIELDISVHASARQIGELY